MATGLDELVSENLARLKARRIGLVANPTSVDRRMRHLADLIAETPGTSLVALFGPEHGIRGDAQDMIEVTSSRDRRTGVPVHSLYGGTEESLRPSAEQLDGIDLIVFDLQDVGSRYYTFAATMLYAMQAAAAQGISFLVLDRPNPIGGEVIEGPTVQPGFESFVGAYPLPIRHGMTLGELSLLFRAELQLDLDLTVIPCRGWRRSMLWDETGIPWVAPSPNMPTPDTALVYSGACLIEGTNLSEGRGTTRPFELWGAPWLAADRTPLDAALLSIEGTEPSVVLLRECAFRPVFHKHAHQVCFGLQPHVIDPRQFRPTRLYTLLLHWAIQSSMGSFEWRTEPYEFVLNPIAIDLLFGSDRERHALESASTSDLIALMLTEWSRDEDAFRERRAPFLLYPEG